LGIVQNRILQVGKKETIKTKLPNNQEKRTESKIGDKMSILKFAREHGLRVVKCRYCKELVIATSPCQKVCKSVGCQRKRNAEKQKRWRDKKAKM